MRRLKQTLFPILLFMTIILATALFFYFLDSERRAYASLDLFPLANPQQVSNICGLNIKDINIDPRLRWLSYTVVNKTSGTIDLVGDASIEIFVKNRWRVVPDRRPTSLDVERIESIMPGASADVLLSLRGFPFINTRLINAGDLFRVRERTEEGYVSKEFEFVRP